MASEFTPPGLLTSTPLLRPAEESYAHPVVPLPYENPFPDADPPLNRAAWIGLQIAHRAGSLALFLLLGGIGALVAGKHAAQILFWTIGAANLGLMGGGVALLKLRGMSREARTLALFNVITLPPSVALFAFRNQLHTRFH